MTLGVAAFGRNAFEAVRATALGAEAMGAGAIGGFAVLAVIDQNGNLQHAVTQRGGVRSLVVDDAWRGATHVALITSGPDRPEPLTQFLVGDPACGLITGHRLPNVPGCDGIPLNKAALDLLSAGSGPQNAVDVVVERNPETDCGLIALSRDGVIGLSNTERVNRRFDTGIHFSQAADQAYGLLHNSIASSVPDFTRRLGDLAWSALSGVSSDTKLLECRHPVTIAQSSRDRVFIDEFGQVVHLESAMTGLVARQGRGTVAYLGSEVWCDGQMVGHLLTEWIGYISNGVVDPQGSRALVMRY